MRGSKRLRRRVGVALVLLAAASAAIWAHGRRAHPPVPGYMQRLGGDFALDSADGVVRLSGFRGDLVLLYFGYTHCPDACPMALGRMAAVIRSLSPDERRHVHGLFVSLDPRRDTPEILKKYVRFYDPSFVGVTGSPEALKGIAARWRISYSLPEHPKDMNYAVEHSTFIYLIDAEGRPVTLFGDDTPLATMRQDIEAWLP
ncbi:MAG TPA: SCO family protein [Mariprofundaceae bacterium]|nr:SCO family protein [Mariprofundaceae bacterium]